MKVVPQAETTTGTKKGSAATLPIKNLPTSFVMNISRFLRFLGRSMTFRVFPFFNTDRFLNNFQPACIVGKKPTQGETHVYFQK